MVYHDRSRQYAVAFPSWRRVAELIEIIDWTRAKFEQEAIMATIAGVPEIFGPK